jgi:hypothetical protein
MKNPWILPAATLVLGAAAGFMTGKNTNPVDANSAVEESARKTRSSNRPESSSATPGHSGKRVNRPESMDAISRLPGNSNRIQALMDFYSGLSASQLADEAAKLDSLPMNERIMASFLLFGRWAEVDATAAMSFSNTMGFTGNFVRPTILQSWASVDPAGAAKYMTDNPREFAMMGMMGGGRGPMGGQSPSSIIASEWARQDPAAAMAWANTLTTDKDQAMNAVVSEVSKADPKKAAEMLASTSGDKSSAYRSIASNYGAQNFSEAQAWVRTLPADEQADALAAAISGLSNKDPNAAAREVASMTAGEAKDHAVSDVVGDLARVNPKAAADLLKQQGSEDALRNGMRELIPAWVNQDAGAALTYANSLEAGKTRDSALQSYVWSNNTGAPADLVKVAETIADQGDRERSIGVATARWMREDATAAKAYVEQSTILSDDAKQRIIEGRGMWGGRGPGGGGR